MSKHLYIPFPKLKYKCSSVFHILDSLYDISSNSQPGRGAEKLQKIPLRYFEDEIFVEGCVATNSALVNSLNLYICSHLLITHPSTQVPVQANSKDCGCFTIYYAQKIFKDPEATMSLIKVE
jgi:hypothetical protein